MPWRQSDVRAEREEFVRLYETRMWSMVELCDAFGVSRPTGYRWIERARGGLQNLENRSSRPHCSPNACDPAVLAMLLEDRERHMDWGPRKLRTRLAKKRPDLVLPAASTLSLHLKKAGLVGKQKRRIIKGETPRRHGRSQHPNDQWTADYKGDFRLGNGSRCYPLTIVDAYSRYLLRCQGRLGVGFIESWPVFESAFEEFGLPVRILSDNGAPFGGHSVCGLSRLSVRLLKLGIWTERIDPGKPQQNGSHERMHRSLKAGLPRPARHDLRAQQQDLNRFRHDYNDERPHEALGMDLPANWYQPSRRAYSPERAGLDYPETFTRRQVHPRGEIKWRGQSIFVTELLAREPLGIEEVDSGIWCVYFGPLRLGWLRRDEPRLLREIPAELRAGR